MGPLRPFSSYLGCSFFSPGLLPPRGVLCDLCHWDVPVLCCESHVLCDVYTTSQGCHRVSGVHLWYLLHIFFWPFW
jgi:hypothetical protein